MNKIDIEVVKLQTVLVTNKELEQYRDNLVYFIPNRYRDISYTDKVIGAYILN